MRIRVIESGGLAGLRRERVVETAELTASVRGELERLLGAAAFFARPRRHVSGLPDVIQYRVRVEDGAHVHEIVFDDEAADEPLVALVRCVLAVRVAG